MPCDNLAKLCPTCLDLASKCSDKIAAEYIPVNSLRHPADTKPFILEFDTTTTFDTHVGGKLIGQSLRDLLEPHLKTTGDDGTPHVRRFHMWIRRYTEAERTAKSTSEPASLPLPVIKVSVLIDLPKVSLRRDAKFLTDVWFSMKTTITDPASGHVVSFLQRSPKLYEEECHDSLYRLMWFHELVKNQPCAPYMFWSNFAPLPRSETKPANVKVEPWFIWRAEHPTTPTGKVAGA
ncbi:hypothetical protein BJX68DRAFT_263579 [Aspergillus pseudodeflectus]|uniref:Aromatic prenyltransferase n=1 Tax=Aspergillus pseudodeflectus TaxID=176178 RepID=A0ABR4KVK3_9EURO